MKNFNILNPENNMKFYSFNLGSVHFINLDLRDFFYGTGGEKEKNNLIDALEADLKIAQKDKYFRPFIIVYGHYPLYCTCVNF
jgi:hypothetical protein